MSSSDTPKGFPEEYLLFKDDEESSVIKPHINMTCI